MSEEVKDAEPNSLRMATIMKVDTAALLASITEIEKAISDYKKPGDVPKWAQALTARVELVERVVNRTPRDGGSGTVASVGGSVSLASVAQEERLLTKMRDDVHHHLSSSNLTVESKINTMTLELDRLQKLLAIRPTVSELQQVVLTIHDMNKKLEDGVKEIQRTVRTQVHGAVAEETASIGASVQSSIDLNAQSIALIAKKVELYNSEITNIRKSTEQACDIQSNHIKQVQFDMQNSKELVLQLEATIEADGKKIEQSLANLKFQDDMTNEKLKDMQNSLLDKMAGVQTAMAANEQLVKTQVAETASVVLDIQSISAATKKDIDDFRFTYEVDTKAQLEANAGILRSMEEMEKRNEEMTVYVAALKDFDVVKAIGLQKEQQAALKASQDDAESGMSSLTNKVNKVLKTLTVVEDRMEKLPLLVDAAMVRMDGIAQTAKELKEGQDAIEIKVSALQLKVKEIDTLRDDFLVLKALVEDNDRKLKQAITTNMSLLEMSSDHETRLERMTELIDNSDAIVEQKMLKMQAEITDVVAAKQAEVEALVANMQENIEVMSLGVDGGSAGSKGAGGAGGGAGAMGRVSRKTVSALQASNPNNFAGAGATSSAGDPTGSMATDEQPELLRQSSDFIADLCINYEEIAVRKSYVNDIPSAMCENIATTAQQIAQFIAHQTDCEAVQIVLRNDPTQVEYDDTLVSGMRQKKMEEFLESVFGSIHANNSKPGAIRSDARKAFMQSLRRALDLCMSKHDQVLVVSNSRFGRVKIPSCIACDRPLVDKVRQDKVKPVDNGPQREFPGFPQFGQQGSIDDSMQSASLVGGVVSGSPVPRLTSKGKSKQSVKLPRAQQEKVVRPNSSHGSSEAAAMRSGMRAPRPGNSAFTSGVNDEGNQDELPALRVSQSVDHL